MRTIPIRYRFAALTAGFVCVSVALFGSATYLEVRRADRAIAADRLIAVTTQVAQLLESSFGTQRRQAAAIAADSMVVNLFADPEGRLPQSLSQASTGAVIGTQLWGAEGRLRFSSGSVPRGEPQLVTRLAGLLGDSVAATGHLHLAGDSLSYPTIAATYRNGSLLGYVIQWRRMGRSSRDREELSRLIGSDAGIHLGNSRGDLWTDMTRPIEGPPINSASPPMLMEYRHPLDGEQLAYAVPIAQTPLTLVIEFPMSAVLQSTSRAVRNLILVALAVLAIGGAGAWIAGHALARPFSDLAAATRALGAGDYQHRIRLSQRDEFGNLAAQFNQMAEAVSGSQAELAEQLERIKSLRAIDLAILGSTDLQLVLRTVVGQTRNRLKVDLVTIMLFNSQTLMLETAASEGTRTQAAARFVTRLGEGVTGLSALERRIVRLPDLTQHMPPDLSPVASQEGLKALFVVPLIAKGNLVGVLGAAHRTPFDPEPHWFDFLEALAGQAAMAIDSGRSFDALQRANLELAIAYDTTIEGWSRAMDLRDKETEGHTQRVAEMTVKLARLAGVSDAELVHVRRGALLHDIGKMGIPDSVLLKPGKLDHEEWALMRMHPVFAHELLSPIPYLRPAIDIPYAHHEKWDGSGYPRGLSGDDIPWPARLFAVIDVWDALRSDRPYRAGWPESRVLDYLRDESGRHFDPDAVHIFFRLVEQGGRTGGTPHVATV